MQRRIRVRIVHPNEKMVTIGHVTRVAVGNISQQQPRLRKTQQQQQQQQTQAQPEPEKTDVNKENVNSIDVNSKTMKRRSWLLPQLSLQLDSGSNHAEHHQKGAVNLAEHHQGTETTPSEEGTGSGSRSGGGGGAVMGGGGAEGEMKEQGEEEANDSVDLIVIKQRYSQVIVNNISKIHFKRTLVFL